MQPKMYPNTDCDFAEICGISAQNLPQFKKICNLYSQQDRIEKNKKKYDIIFRRTELK